MWPKFIIVIKKWMDVRDNSFINKQLSDFFEGLFMYKMAL